MVEDTVEDTIEVEAEEEKQENEVGSETALLFELENVAVEGRKIAFDVLRSLLSSGDAKITRDLYMKHCLESPPQQFLAGLLKAAGRKKAPPERLADEVREGIGLSLIDGSVKMDPAVGKLLADARGRNISVGALTSLDQEIAERLMEKLGLDGSEVALLSSSASDRCFPTADAWLKLAKSMAVDPVGCTVMATSVTSARAVLSAGMRCIVVPDEFTSFQDFSGTDMVIDKLADEDQAEILSFIAQ
jgi:beta-phosphoglucomutase-like phosphatase (HAD superfamily)